MPGLSNNRLAGVLPPFELLDQGICELGGNDITCRSTGTPACSSAAVISTCASGLLPVKHEKVPPWGIALITIGSCILFLLLGLMTWVYRRRDEIDTTRQEPPAFDNESCLLSHRRGSECTNASKKI
ncbi:hypothetical protein K7432_010545 [Basidiobolus ranarum]|uniref:Uncharacterized protein n=1 Tax=Basidiobolus ranarum TaxID=34480 RepID=A0ABR2VVS9_9FUNG